MKMVVLLLLSMLGFPILASSVEWADFAVLPVEFGEKPQFHGYFIYGTVWDETNWCNPDGPLFAYEGADGLYLKQYDHRTYSMPADNNVWALVNAGDLLSHETLETALQIPLAYYEDWSENGGTKVSYPSDFYLGFMVTGRNTSDGLDRFGWYHVLLDGDLDMTILDVGIGFYGESVIVGVGPIPEPQTWLLFLLGVGMLGLRRRH